MLSRFYGLSFSELARMPRVFVQMYVDALPRIRALEQMYALDVSTFAHMKENAQKRVIADINKDLNKGVQRERPKPEPVSREQFGALAGAIGIGFEEVSSDMGIDHGNGDGNSTLQREV